MATNNGLEFCKISQSDIDSICERHGGLIKDYFIPVLTGEYRENKFIEYVSGKNNSWKYIYFDNGDAVYLQRDSTGIKSFAATFNLDETSSQRDLQHDDNRVLKVSYHGDGRALEVSYLGEEVKITFTDDNAIKGVKIISKGDSQPETNSVQNVSDDEKEGVASKYLEAYFKLMGMENPGIEQNCPENYMPEYVRQIEEAVYIQDVSRRFTKTDSKKNKPTEKLIKILGGQRKKPIIDDSAMEVWEEAIRIAFREIGRQKREKGIGIGKINDVLNWDGDKINFANLQFIDMLEGKELDKDGRKTLLAGTKLINKYLIAAYERIIGQKRPESPQDPVK